jgi:hypothetical protein
MFSIATKTPIAFSVCLESRATALRVMNGKLNIWKSNGRHLQPRTFWFHRQDDVFIIDNVDGIAAHLLPPPNSYIFDRLAIALHPIRRLGLRYTDKFRLEILRNYVGSLHEIIIFGSGVYYEDDESQKLRFKDMAKLSEREDNTVKVTPQKLLSAGWTLNHRGLDSVCYLWGNIIQEFKSILEADGGNDVEITIMGLEYN